jgi:hypothetical protein
MAALAGRRLAAHSSCPRQPRWHAIIAGACQLLACAVLAASVEFLRSCAGDTTAGSNVSSPVMISTTTTKRHKKELGLHSLEMPLPTLAKVDDRIAGAAQQALESLLKHRRCASFVYEVDPDELGLVNYFEIVTEPMCLDLVKRKLQVTPAFLLLLLHVLNRHLAEKGVQNRRQFSSRCGARLQERYVVQSARRQSAQGRRAHVLRCLAR